MRVATVAVYVEDPDQASRFWTETVGLVVRRSALLGVGADGLEGRWTEVSLPEAETRLLLYPKLLRQDWRERKPSIVFECENLAQTYEALLARGVIFAQQPQATAEGAFAIFVDPEGNAYGLREQKTP